MTKGLSGVRADQKRSYRSLEKYACHVRKHLKLAPPRCPQRSPAV
jgi:hypothetical protein